MSRTVLCFEMKFDIGEQPVDGQKATGRPSVEVSIEVADLEMEEGMSGRDQNQMLEGGKGEQSRRVSVHRREREKRPKSRYRGCNSRYTRLCQLGDPHSSSSGVEASTVPGRDIRGHVSQSDDRSRCGAEKERDSRGLIRLHDRAPAPDGRVTVGHADRPTLDLRRVVRGLTAADCVKRHLVRPRKRETKHTERRVSEVCRRPRPSFPGSRLGLTLRD